MLHYQSPLLNFRQRDYGHDGQIGMEDDPRDYVDKMVAVFREVRRVLKEKGVLWLNLGDAYAGSGKHYAANGHGYGSDDVKQFTNKGGLTMLPTPIPPGYKRKDLLMVPYRVAMGLQSDGWYLRQAIPWVKRNAMPEPTKDRPNSAVETVFLLSKSDTYYFDMGNIKVAARVEGRWPGVGPKHAKERARDEKYEDMTVHPTRNRRNSDWWFESVGMLMSGDVEEPEVLGFDVPTTGYKGAHFATMPEKLVEPMVLSSCRPGGTVLDPFCGSGTVGAVAAKYGRDYLLIDLNEEYCQMSLERVNKVQMVFSEAEAAVAG